MRRSIVPFLLLVSLAACAGDPDLAGSTGSLEARELEVGPAIERARWVPAPAGCEDAGATSALHRAAGEPLLGVLLDARGAVVCVDALGLLIRERVARPLVHTAPHRDPTPTPVILGSREDPTPTPIVEPTLPRL